MLVAAGAVSASDLHFHHLNLEQGLPSSRVQAFTQDQHGFIWAGTDAGLVRYDGYETLVFQHNQHQSQSLSSNKVRALHADALGQLWVGTEDRGLNRFDPVQQTFTKIQFQGYQPKWIFAITEALGKLYIGTNEGLFELSLQQTSATHVQISRNFKVRSLTTDSYNNIWVGTAANGIFRYRQENNGELTQFMLPDETKQQVFSLTVDEVNTLWIAYGQQLYSKANGSSVVKRELADQLPYSVITSVRALQNGHIAIGSLAGLFLFNPNNAELLAFQPHNNFSSSLQDQQIYQLFEDRGGSLWVGTFTGGASYVNPKMLKFGLDRNTGNCPVTDAEDIKQDHLGRTWVARLNGATRISPDGRCEQFGLDHQGVEDLNYIELFFDSNQRTWAQLELNGLALFDPDSSQFRLLMHPTLESLTVLDIFESKPDQFWLGTERGGLYLFDPEQTLITPIAKLQSLTIYDIQAYQGGLLMATSDGALLYQPENQVFSNPFDLPSGLEVLNILVDEYRQVVWLGTNGNGLYQGDIHTGAAISIEATTGFLGENIHTAVIDRHGTVWISSNRGLFQQPVGAALFTHVNSRDGLQNRTFTHASYVLERDLLLFSGINGINIFKPTDITANPVGPNVVFTRFTRPGEWQTGQLIQPLTSIELSHGLKDFSFEMAALSFDDPQRNQYAYQLENYDQSWIYTDASQRRASYTSLPPGNYRLRAKAANKDGIWGATETSISIYIKPAPWFTWWAKTVYLLIIMALLYGLHRWRNLAAIRRADELQAEVRHRTFEIAQQKSTIEGLLERKNDLFAAISHEFRTPLTLLLGPLDGLYREVDGSMQQKVKLVKRNSLRLLTLVDQLLAMAKTVGQSETVRKPQQLTAYLVGLVELFNAAAELRGITIHSADVSADIYVLAEDDSLELILGNILSNAIKYSPLNSIVDITINENVDNVTISITDQGMGISQSDQAAIFERFYRAVGASGTQGTGLGLAVAKETVEANHGSIALKSIVGQGSVFSVTLQRAVSANNKQPRQIQSNVIDSELRLLKELPSTPIKPVRVESETGNEKPLVLIIEDNQEMRAFIGETLSSLYQFSEADNGADGIHEALRLIPDIIICDIMMPKQDGFAVTRTLRHDLRTSHIPIVLLTARVDQSSRIRGWREHIDEYLCKPFSPEELQARISSILAVRQILQRRFNANNSINVTQQQLEVSLNEFDQKFLNKLDACMEKNYSDIEFSVTCMSNAVTMSYRQLQRKLKALIGYSPSEYLREFRLKKAAKMLVSGYQVRLVSDSCGFSSPNQFSRCFKARFGVVPKQYQQKSTLT